MIELRAPRDHEGILAHPPLADAAKLLEANLAHLPNVGLVGRSLSDLRQSTRREVFDLARQYHREAGETSVTEFSDRWIVAGHQPEIFHPGVWVKNFALGGMAKRLRATALNLIVDNDTGKSVLLKAPQGSRMASLPFDHFQGETPFEERPVLDEDIFASLPQRAASVMKEWPFQPILQNFWQAMQRANTPLLGERIVRARRQFERAWGCTNLEIPLSRVCGTEGFAVFALHLLQDMPRLHRIYNEVLHEYRKVNGLKSPQHPVPDLSVQGDWLETPLWAWRTGDARRGRLFARPTAQGIELRRGGEPWPTLKADDVEGFRSLAQQGYKIRTRALTTTLFSRLLLGDLFVHGIGGGKYDELTDGLFSRWLGIEPPRYMVLSATLLLPFPKPTVTANDVSRLAWYERDLWWNPQRHGAGPSQEKLAWIERTPVTKAERKERFLAIRAETEKLREILQSEKDALHHQRLDAAEALQESLVRGRRDFAFCWYPEELLEMFMMRFSD